VAISYIELSVSGRWRATASRMGTLRSLLIHGVWLFLKTESLDVSRGRFSSLPSRLLGEKVAMQRAQPQRAADPLRREMFAGIG
jgi:hypothetical protein